MLDVVNIMQLLSLSYEIYTEYTFIIYVLKKLFVICMLKQYECHTCAK